MGDWGFMQRVRIGGSRGGRGGCAEDAVTNGRNTSYPQNPHFLNIRVYLNGDQGLFTQRARRLRRGRRILHIRNIRSSAISAGSEMQFGLHLPESLHAISIISRHTSLIPFSELAEGFRTAHRDLTGPDSHSGPCQLPARS